MGEIVGIKIGSYEFLSYKNTFGDLLTIFCPEDRCVKECTDDDGESYTCYSFITTVERAKKSLDCLGFTVEAARNSFDKSKQEEIEFLDECFDAKHDQYDSKVVREKFTFDKWCTAAKRYALMLSKDHFAYTKCQYKNLEKQRKRKDLSVAERIVLDSLPFEDNEHFFGIYFEYTSRWEIFRVLLDAFEPNMQIVLDYTDLFNGGWCNEFPEDSDFSVQKTIILTEGKYDADVISKSMQILYPYMKKYYSFIDFSGANVQGSTSFLTHYVKAFIGAGIQNRIIALYDNDATGCSEIELLKTISPPLNFRIITLPHIELAENYPTIGPTKDECVDINRKACSIELFLGRDVLTENGNLIPIMWKGYIDKIGTYQGEIIKKGEVQKKFNRKAEATSINGIIDFEIWREMDLLLNTIFQAFINYEGEQKRK
ncbi:HEPN/Toprim-associated domain-containing protein [Desulfosporosinus sp. PR]|uniref:HEPN/Toprim-associated domain-containing protein n=1 Tax=Candidatus Desulfosporosinus nitrosoreducens TaxID=3401928 RepID=UPI0027F1C938|nr:HEPN/Toprim-associated domain-containing protein [Desulfosporosinus sp. PR]MDQ7095473.1 HEPN/Toprim-associated domain-containing protein [Desulfosporosinus sp. PR]